MGRAWDSKRSLPTARGNDQRHMIAFHSTVCKRGGHSQTLILLHITPTSQFQGGPETQTDVNMRATTVVRLLLLTGASPLALSLPPAPLSTQVLWEKCKTAGSNAVSLASELGPKPICVAY
jgi:hypothetical protein